MSSLAELDNDKPNNRLNDGKVDPFGRLLTGKTVHLFIRACAGTMTDSHVCFFRNNGAGGTTG